MLGEVTSSNQVTAGQTYAFSYGYNLAGALLNETYPSGRVVGTSYDGANRPISVTGNQAGQMTPYVTGVTTYWPHGAPYYFTYGNGLTRATAYNARLQPLETYDALTVC